VSSAAKNVCATPLQGDNLEIRITIYYNGLPTFDNDNVLKPLCDALKGICYTDDHQISTHHISRRPLEGYAGRIKNPSPELLDAISRKKDFVYIEISE